MSKALLGMVNDLLAGKISAEAFSDEYIDTWRRERYAGLLAKDPDALNEAFSSIFCHADNFNPDPYRMIGEVDADGLRLRILQTLQSLDVHGS